MGGKGIQAVASSNGNILTNRELSVLALAGRGLTNEQIGVRLSISVRTVKATLHRACVKLGAHNRTEAAIRAVRRGALNVQDIFSTDELVDLLASLPPEVLLKAAERAGGGDGHGRWPFDGMRNEDGDGSQPEKAGGVECAC